LLVDSSHRVILSNRASKPLGDWLTAAEVAEVAGLSPRNPSAQPKKWKKQGLVFAISHGGVDYFLAYGLDRNNGFRPVKALAKVIEVLSPRKDA